MELNFFSTLDTRSHSSNFSVFTKKKRIQLVFSIFLAHISEVKKLR